MAKNNESTEDSFKSAQRSFNNLAGELSKIEKDYQKAINDAVKQTSKLTGGWKDIGKYVTDSLKGVKNIETLEKKIQASKSASKAFDDVVKQGLVSRKKISTDLQNIGEEMNTLSAGMGKEALPAMTKAERDRWNYLNYQKSSLENQATLQGKQIRDAITQRNTQNQITKSQEEELDKKKKSLNVVEAVLNVLSLTKDAMVGLIKLGETYDKVLMKFANSLGVGRIEAEKYVPALNAAAQEVRALGASLEDSFDNASAITHQFDLMATANLKEINVQMLTLNKGFGIAVEDSAKFYSTLTQVGNASLSSQTYMTGVADAAAKAAGVPLGRVIKDVANISDGVRLIFKGNTEQLIKQAAEARKLGTSLDSAAKSAESLLNFETSVGNELKLSALLGKNVDFNESRRLFFAGKTVEAEKAILVQLNKIGDINDLNYFQRKALADVTGKTFQELQKMQAQSKQQLDLDAKFPQFAAERLKYEEKLKKISGDELEQKKQSQEMQARDNIANARANVFLKQKEQILLNLSRAIQPFYRILTDISERLLDIVVGITDWIASLSKVSPALSATAAAVGVLVVGVVGLASAIGLVVLAFRGLSRLGIQISTFLTEVSFGLTAFGLAGLTAVPVILSIAAAIAAIGVAAWGLGKLFSGIGDLIRSILEPIVKFIDVIVTGFNNFITNIGSATTNIANGLKTITDIGFFSLAKSAAGVAMMAESIAGLGAALALFPMEKLNGFATNFSSITNANAASLNKLSELFESASVTGGKLMIGIEDGAVTAINKLSDLKGERDELKQTIRESNDRLVKSIETLTNLMANGGIAVNLNGQRVNEELAKTNFRSGGYGQSTAR